MFSIAKYIKYMLRDLIKCSFSSKSIKLCGGICVGKQFRVMQKHVI